MTEGFVESIMQFGLDHKKGPRSILAVRSCRHASRASKRSWPVPLSNVCAPMELSNR